MTPENFAYWLQGFFELAGTDNLTPEQVKIVKDHLALVFTKVTPDRHVKTKKDRKAKKSKSPLFDLERFLKEADKQRDFRDMTVTCSETSLPEDTQVFCSALGEAAKVDAPIDREKIDRAMEKAREKIKTQFPLPTRWVGGGFGQKYC